MKIRRMNNKGFVVFGDITPGTVFEYCDIIYMKHKLGKIVNAVRLEDGAGASFIGHEKVVPLDAELVIK